MRNHPIIAYKLLSLIEYMQGSSDISYCYHENGMAQVILAN